MEESKLLKGRPDIEESWYNALKSEFESDYFRRIKQQLLEAKSQGAAIYPKGVNIFRAFNLTPLGKVKVVILGQDPYHGPGQANGLSFSVNEGIAVPPSLRNIFKEMQDDLGVKKPDSGDLTGWAEQGVLLLNSVLTVEMGRAASHAQFGWQRFTDAAIHAVSLNRPHVVFILWGKYAQSKIPLIDPEKHFIITSAHPSPLSARLFFGSRPFSKANAWLNEKGLAPINWAHTR